MTSVLLLVLAENSVLTMGFYWSYVHASCTLAKHTMSFLPWLHLGHHEPLLTFYRSLFPHLLFWQLLSNGALIHGQPLFLQGLLCLLDTISFHVACTHKNTLQCTQTKVIVRLARELLITQPIAKTQNEGHYHVAICHHKVKWKFYLYSKYVGTETVKHSHGEYSLEKYSL